MVSFIEHGKKGERITAQTESGDNFIVDACNSTGCICACGW